MNTTALKEKITSLVQVKEKAQITLPYKIRQFLGVKQGDYLEARVKNNQIILVPKTLLDKMPTVSLSQKGQKVLNKALEDAKKGRVRKFNNIKDLIEELHV